jgi:hypothetical protein
MYIHGEFYKENNGNLRLIISSDKFIRYIKKTDRYYYLDYDGFKCSASYLQVPKQSLTAQIASKISMGTLTSQYKSVFALELLFLLPSRYQITLRDKSTYSITEAQYRKQKENKLLPKIPYQKFTVKQSEPSQNNQKN